ncbi:uncharacterized protein LOC108713819 [Xenopus laevis]|uniref:Uncharacterized protein LOC108713819 n=2 Tax=Xenopus laevis TaxID=8355 RepID=A0A1L8GJ82_XENLA|nr:uncharacterized protein LOC108713819 [Xenopus laevis]XP_018112953.1 uncharacterized protein LOC108713819 [Xenopus laevis]OCT83856.1 hypothetical protein XELAEV_18021995mg [Xenopus laevis]
MKSADREERMQKEAKKQVTYSETPDNNPAESRVEESHEGESVNEGPEVFEGLCERMLSALSLVQTSVSEVLDLKDEVIVHNVPSSLQTQLSLCTARLFRSLLDLYVPSTELVRLVRVFGPQWEKNLLTLKQLQGEHERLQRLLSLALHRVQNVEAQSRRDARAQPYRNWETLFVRLMRMGPYKPSQEMIQDLEVSRSGGQTSSQDTGDAALHKAPFAHNGM